MRRSSLYLNYLYQQIAVNYSSDFIHDLPPEIGRLEVRRQSTKQGIHFLDWQMRYNRDIEVKREGELEHEEIQIIFFVNRGMDWNVDSKGSRVQTKKGELCIYKNREMITSACYPGNCDFEFRSVQIPAGYFWSTIREHLDEMQVAKLEGLLGDEVIQCMATPQMWRLLGEMQQLEPYAGMMMSLQLEGKVLEMIALCLNELMIVSPAGRTSRQQLSRTDQETIQEARRVINGQPAAVLGCKELARQLGINTSKLSKGFLAMYGVTLHAYVIERRLEQAASLLADGRCNVSQAAILSGYSNMSHFSASFKKKYGMLPKEYK